MPFFNFRRGSNASAASQAAAPESAEALRRRAKHRLIGSAVLVLAGVIGFPLVFDTQPRPVAVDIPIEIPGKTAVKPLVLPSPNTAAPPAAVAVPAAVPPTASSRAGGEKVAAAASLAPEEEIIPSKPAMAAAAKASAAPKPEPKPVLPPSAKPTPKAEVKADAKTEARADSKPPVADEAARARALLNGTPVPTSTSTAVSAAAQANDASERFIVQVGAFAEQTKAREARLKVEGAGLKTYTQVAETPSGKRIRVRVGPFASRADADKAASKIKTLGLSAAILTL